MLKYKIKINNEFSSNEIITSSLYVSDKLEYISGVTDRCYELTDSSTVLVHSDYTDSNIVLPIIANNVKRQGYVLVDYKYPIKEAYTYESHPISRQYFIEADGIEYNINDIVGNGKYEKYEIDGNTLRIYYIEDFVEKTYEIEVQNISTIVYSEDVSVYYNGVEIAYNEEVNGFIIDETIYPYDGEYQETVNIKRVARYIEYEGNYYYLFDNDYINGVVVNDRYYEFENGDYIVIPTKFYIDDGVLSIDGIEYVADMDIIKDSEGNYEPPTIRESATLSIVMNLGNVYDFEPEKWKTVTKFTIYSNTLVNLNVASVDIGKYVPYVDYFGNTYPIINNSVYIDEVEYPFYPNKNGEQFIVIENKPYPVSYSFVLADDGDKIALNLDNGNYYINLNDKIICESISSSFTLLTNVDENNKEYINFGGKKYVAIERLCDTVNVYGTDYVVHYDVPYQHFVISMNNVSVGFNVDENLIATYDHRVMINKNGLVEYDLQTASTENSGFTVNAIDGFEVNGNKYPILSTFDEENNEIRYVEINEPTKYELRVSEIIGNSTLLCIPIVDETLYTTETNLEYACVDICKNIKYSFSNFIFNKFDPVFGSNYKNAELGVIPSLYATHPISLYDIIDFTSGLTLIKIVNYYSIPLSLGNKIATNINKEDLINNEFVNDKIQENINTVVDMEKDIYYPAYRNNEGEFEYINELRFNLHFRTRTLDNWKIIEDDTEEVGVVSKYNLTAKYNESVNIEKTNESESITAGNNSDMSNWFITDYYDYKSNIERENKISLQNASDLLGFVDFSDDDIIHQKMRLSKSFIRLSFYSTDNPQTQMLLATSTVFFNEHKSFLKKTTYTESNYRFQNVRELSSSTRESSFTVNAISENINEHGKTVVSDDDKRLSSRFLIRNKYDTDTSSEGFYMYMFKEYSNKLREATIFLRVDFYHAGIGRSFPFYMPMRYNENDVPNPLYLDSEDDVKLLKKGVLIKEAARQIYIPIRLKYDINNKKYVYYLPDNYRENDKTKVENNVMEFNLFELKIRNESHANDN